MELRRISSDPEDNEVDVHQTIRRSQTILQRRYGENNPDLDVLLTLIAEVATNVTHSRDVGYIFIQSYKDHEGIGSQVELSIADAGIGIEKSLKERWHIPIWRRRRMNGSGYILLALQEGVTAEAGRRGLGLARVRDLVTRWQGQLYIRSGRSAVEMTPGQVNRFDDLPFMPGTQVTIEVRGDYSPPSPLDLPF